MWIQLVDLIDCCQVEAKFKGLVKLLLKYELSRLFLVDFRTLPLERRRRDVPVGDGRPGKPDVHVAAVDGGDEAISDGASARQRRQSELRRNDAFLQRSG